MSTTLVHRVRAALLLQKLKILVLLAGAEAIYNGMLANVARFPSPAPTLVMLLAQITALRAAQAIVASGVHGAPTAARDAARDALWLSLVTLKAYVQSIADASEASAVEIIKSAGFDVAATRTGHTKPILAAKLTATASEVKLVANATALVGTTKKRVAYNWQYSIDGGHTWVLVPSTITANTVIAGLPLTTNCSFRVCVTIKTVMQPWSQVVSLLVH